MADFEATSRSNYFAVKDAAAFASWCNRIGLHYEKHDKKDLYAVFGDYCDHGEWPDPVEESGEFTDQLMEHLADGEICVLMQVGAEKLRYVAGFTVAFNNKGECVNLSLSEIYDRARVAFGTRPSAAEY